MSAWCCKSSSSSSPGSASGATSARRRRGSGPWMLIALAVVTVAVAFAAVQTRRDHVMRVSDGGGGAAGAGGSAAVLAPAFHPTDDMLVDADTHASLDAAARALAARWARQAGDAASRVDRVTLVVPRGQPAALADAVRGALALVLPQATIVVRAGDDAAGADVEAERRDPARAATALRVEAGFRPVRSPAPRVYPRPRTRARGSAGGAEPLEGTLDLRFRGDVAPAAGPEASEDVTTPLGSSAFSTAVDERPWLAAERPVVGRAPAGRWVVAFSADAAAPDQAVADAMRRAVGQVYAAGEPELARRLRGRIDAADRAALHQALAAELLRRGPAEQFVQGIERPYGRFYRAAVLVPAAPTDALARAAASVSAERARPANTVVAVVILAGLILLLYAFLNAVTRGYFAGRLRLAAAGLLAAIVVVVMLVA